jgi:hypothetical protein
LEDLFEILGRSNKVLGRKGCGMLTWILNNENSVCGLDLCGGFLRLCGFNKNREFFAHLGDFCILERDFHKKDRTTNYCFSEDAIVQSV